MAYNEGTAERIRTILADRRVVQERKMFGGLAFMVRGHMCCGVVDDTLMARVGPDHYVTALGQSHVREMDFTGKPMKGFVYVDPLVFESDELLRYWVGLCKQFVASLPPR